MYQDMQQGHIGGPVFFEEGAEYTGKGKYRLHFLGSSNPREITKWVVIVVVAAVLAVLLAATLLSGREPSVIPYETKLWNTMGQPLENALVNAGLKTAEIKEIQTGIYVVDVDVKADGVPFDLHLYVENGVLSGFAYTAEYGADVRKAAKDICNIASAIAIDSYVPVEGAEPVEISRKTILEHLKQGKDLRIEPDGVNVTPTDLVGALRGYLDDLETSEDWEGNVHGYLVRHAQVYLDGSIAYMQDTNTVKMQISYRVEAERPIQYTE